MSVNLIYEFNKMKTHTNKNHSDHSSTTIIKIIAF